MNKHKAHVKGPTTERAWCGRAVELVRLKPKMFNWEDRDICGSCYRRAEEAQIREARAVEADAERIRDADNAYFSRSTR